MGSSNSRLGQRSSQPRSNRSVKGILRSFVCGSSSSSSDVPIHEMEDYQVELLSRSAEWHEPIVVDRLQSSTKECSSIICSENDCSCFTTESGTLSDRSCSTSEAHSIECSSKYAEIGNTEKCLSKRKELVPDLLDVAYSPSEPYLEKTGDISCSSSIGQCDIHKKQRDVGCCSSEGQQSLHSESVQAGSSSDAAAKVSDPVHESGSEIGQERVCSSNMSTENLLNSVVGVHGADSSSVPVNTNPSVTSIQTQDDIVQVAAPTIPGHVMPDTLQDRGNGSILHVDVVSISSNTFFSSTGEISNREVRRNSRRLFWDAFSRRSSRRHSDSQTIFLSSEDTDDLGSHDRWLLDLSGDLFEDGAGSDTGYLGNRGHGMYQGRWHSRSEIWERLHGGFEESGRRASFCASGLHPYGSCSCESFLMAEESGTHGSISRIVMLAEALFEVLDEIHQQPVSVSLSMVSLPAPESVVDSFPLKNHKKPSAAENGDAEQCYICLADYEEGDKIRVLPCHHEYHMLCVDKWLKEIHGVCPLCRGDVCEGAVEGPILSS